MGDLTSTELLRIEVENLRKLLSNKERLLREAEEIDGLETNASGVIIRPTEFAHMELRDAALKFFQITGKPRATLSEMLPVLRQGGADLGKQKDRHHRNLKIAIRMNSKTSAHPFQFDPDNEIVSPRALEKKRQSA